MTTITNHRVSTLVDLDAIREALYDGYRYSKVSIAREVAMLLMAHLAASHASGHRKHQISEAWAFDDLARRGIEFDGKAVTRSHIKQAKTLLSKLGIIKCSEMSVKGKSAAWWVISSRFTKKAEFAPTNAAQLRSIWFRQIGGQELIAEVQEAIKAAGGYATVKRMILEAEKVKAPSGV